MSPKKPLAINSTLYRRYKITGILCLHDRTRVYQARDMHLPTVQRYIAIKEILHLRDVPDLRNDMIKNLEASVNLFAGLNHPGMAHVYESFLTRDAAYVVMKYIPGRDLQALVRVSGRCSLPILSRLIWS